MVPRIVRSVALFLCLFLALFAGIAANGANAQTEAPGKESQPYAPGEHAVIWGVSQTKPATAAPQLQSADPRDKNAVIMSQGFEGSWPTTGWTRVDQSTTDGGEFLLGKRNCDPRTDSFAGWMAGGGSAGNNLACGANYPPNLNTWAEYGPFNLSTATSAELTFYIKGESEWDGVDTCYDFLFVGAGTNGTNYDGGTWCGDFNDGSNGNGYWGYIVDLSDFNSTNYLGQPQVYIAFAMVSDATVQFHGLTLDDISLDVVSSCATPAAPTLTAPANGASLSDTTPTFTWNSVANANEYEIEVDNNSDFSSPVVDQTRTQTNFTPGVALAAGTYFWRVGANNTAGGCSEFSPWSAVRSFTITTAPTCFQLTLDHTGQGSNPVPSPNASAGCSAGRYTAGQAINLTANPANGWRVNGWLGTNNNNNTSTSNTATMPAANHTVRVNYVEIPGGNDEAAYLPSVHWGLTGFVGPFEIEPNNSTGEANGPILVNRNYQGFPNDQSDWFYFDLTAQRQISVVLTNITGTDPQLQLFHNSSSNRVGFDATPPFSISHNAPPGRYYVRVVVVGGYNQTTPYTLRVNQ